MCFIKLAKHHECQCVAQWVVVELCPKGIAHDLRFCRTQKIIGSLDYTARPYCRTCYGAVLAKMEREYFERLDELPRPTNKREIMAYSQAHEEVRRKVYGRIDRFKREFKYYHDLDCRNWAAPDYGRVFVYVPNPENHFDYIPTLYG